ncbi:MAG: hypothetical protein RIK87_30790 [Fuerstiella sp.]
MIQQRPEDYASADLASGDATLTAPDHRTSDRPRSRLLRRGLNRVKPKTGASADGRRKELKSLRRVGRTQNPDTSEQPALDHAVQPTLPLLTRSAEFQSTDIPSAESSSAGSAKADLLPADFPSVDFPSADFPSVDTSPGESKATAVSDDGAIDDDADTAALSFSVTEPPPPDVETYQEWFQRVVVPSRWLTWFFTFYVHWVLVLTLAAIIVHGPENTASLLLNAAFSAPTEPEPQTFEIITTEPIPEQETEPEAATIPDPEPTALTENDVDLAPKLLEELAVSDKGAGAAPADDSSADAARQAKASSQAHVNPAPPLAVSEGSFSVWTEPSHPVAGQPYHIVIQVRLPDSIRKYDLSDLQGVVVGSDGYRKPIPGSLRGSLPIDNGYARFVVPIVSADVNVRDTVFIRSRLLKETQKLVLQF